MKHNISVQSLVENVIIEAFAEGAFTDSKGNKIVTGRFVKRVKDNGDRGKIVGVTSELKVRVLWHYSNDYALKDKKTIESPTDLIILR